MTKINSPRKKNKKVNSDELTTREFTEIFIEQFHKNLFENIEILRSASKDLLFKNLHQILDQIENDFYHFLKNYYMCQEIVNVDENGKPKLKGNQFFKKEFNFVKFINQDYREKFNRFMPYKDVIKAIEKENDLIKQRNKPGEFYLEKISENTYTNYKKLIKAN